MLTCWYVNPETRPSFHVLEKQLAEILGHDIAEQCMDMNQPYVEMNANWLRNGKTDYLAMMALPIDMAPPVMPLSTAGYVNLPILVANLFQHQDHDGFVDIPLHEMATTPLN